MTCAGTDEEIDEYWKDVVFMNINRESYLNYTNIESPVQSTVNWNSMRLSSDEISYGIYGVKITKFESEDQKLSFSQRKVREF